LRKSSKYIACLGGLLFGLCAWAQETESETILFESDYYELPEPRDVPATHLTEQDWEEAKRGIDYGAREPEEIEEEVEEPENEDSSEDDGPSWLEKILDDLSGISINQKFLSAFLIGMVILILVWLIVKLVGNHQQNANTRLSSTELHFALDQAEENLEESDLDRLLRLALEQNDHKTAIRVYYLAVLKDLSIAGLIQWKKDKTNADYLKEMVAHHQFDSFRMATYAYEKVWYGDLEISAQDHAKLAPLFKRLIRTAGHAE
jgi:hypothetical protein